VRKFKLKPIVFFTDIIYQEEDSFEGVYDKEDQWDLKGWYYEGITLIEPKSNSDAIYISHYKGHAKDIDKEQVDNKFYRLNKLKEKNSEQLEYLQINIEHLLSEQKKLPAPIGLIRKRINYYSTMYYYFNEWFSQTYKKETTSRAPIHNKNYSKEANFYIKEFLTRNKKPTNEQLQKSSGKKFNRKISTTTWSRRTKDLTFLAELLKQLEKKIYSARLIDNMELCNKLENIQFEVKIMLTKNSRTKKNQDIYDKGGLIDKKKELNKLGAPNTFDPDDIKIEPYKSSNNRHSS
jgi:hypothetical protein